MPHWAGPDHFAFVDLPFGDKRRACIRVRRVPEQHLELRAFCQRVQDELRLKLYYRGESCAVVGHKFVHEMLVRKREAICDSEKKALMDRQQQRCARCRDLLSRWEVHHDPPVADGGGEANSGICLLCPTCHAEQTERQELKGNQQSPQYFESQLNPEMMAMFEAIPRPKQLCWGDAAARARALAQDDLTPINCMDVRGCRKNALLTRKWLPVGCPMDTLLPVFSEAGQ